MLAFRQIELSFQQETRRSFDASPVPTEYLALERLRFSFQWVQGLPCQRSSHTSNRSSYGGNEMAVGQSAGGLEAGISAHQLGKSFRIKGAIEVVSLRNLASSLRQPGDLFFGFHSFGYRFQP